MKERIERKPPDPEEGSVEIDLAQLRPLEGATNKNTIYLDASGSVFYKLHSEKERANYTIIEKFRAHFEQKNIYFSKLVHAKVTDQKGGTLYLGISKIPSFHSYDISEHFGDFKLQNLEVNLGTYLDALEEIARTIPVETFSDYDEEEFAGVLMFLNQSYPLLQKDLENLVSLEELVALFEKSQESVQKLSRVVQHKDANPSNWRAISHNDKTVIAMVDLETLGLARRGWDEGRMYTLLGLDSKKQELFLNLISTRSTFNNADKQTYFWRVVLFRTIREMLLLNSEKYRESLESYNGKNPHENIKERIMNSLKNTAQRAVKELRVQLPL